MNSGIQNMIMLWSGAIANIPKGFRLCDGNLGTPDLRNRFIVGAGSTYAPDDSGGANAHTHTFTDTGHTHTHQAGAGIDSGPNRDATTTNNADTGTTDSTNHRPTYFALAYIMKT